MKFDCPQCKQRLESDDLPPDSEVSCPSCSTTFRPCATPESESGPDTQSQVAPPTAESNENAVKPKRLTAASVPLFYALVLTWLCWASYMLVKIKNEADSCASSYQMSELENKVEYIASDVDNINSYVGGIKSDVSGIKSDVSTIVEAIKPKYRLDPTLRTVVDSIASDVSRIKSDVGSIESDVSDIESVISTIERDVRSIKNR